MKIYKCMECGDCIPCYAVLLINRSENRPSGCIGGARNMMTRDKSVWCDSDEYELFKKDKFKIASASSATTEKIDHEIIIEDDLYSGRTPNCSICKWHRFEIEKHICVAQGFSDCEGYKENDIYNSNACQKLFEIIKNEVK